MVSCATALSKPHMLRDEISFDLAAVPPKLVACISCLQPNPACQSPRSKRLP